MRRPRKVQVLRDLAEKTGTSDHTQVSREAFMQLLDLAEATANYFSYPRKAKPGVHREGRDKFNRIIDTLGKFDFGTYAPDELRADDFE